MLSYIYRLPIGVSAADKERESMKIIRDPFGSFKMFLHTSVLFSPDGAMSARSSDVPEMTKKLLKQILDVPGVQDIYVDRYKFCIERARAFEWDDILPTVEKLISETGNQIITLPSN